MIADGGRASAITHTRYPPPGAPVRFASKPHAPWEQLAPLATSKNAAAASQCATREANVYVSGARPGAAEPGEKASAGASGHVAAARVRNSPRCNDADIFLGMREEKKKKKTE
jgi:hypothetical protein